MIEGCKMKKVRIVCFLFVGIYLTGCATFQPLIPYKQEVASNFDSATGINEIVIAPIILEENLGEQWKITNAGVDEEEFKKGREVLFQIFQEKFGEKFKISKEKPTAGEKYLQVKTEIGRAGIDLIGTFLGYGQFLDTQSVVVVMPENKNLVDYKIATKKYWLVDNRTLFKDAIKQTTKKVAAILESKLKKGG